MKKNFIVVLTFLFFSSLSFSAKVGDPVFQYKFKAGTTYKYSMNSDIKQTVTMMGQEQVTNIKQTAMVSIQVTVVNPDGSFKTVIWLDTLSMEFDNPQIPSMAEAMKKFIGKKYNATILKNGEIIDISPVDGIVPEEDKKAGDIDPQSQIKKLLVVFPDKDSVANNSWNQIRTDSTKQMGANVATKTEFSGKVGPVEPYEKEDSYKIDGDQKMTMSGSGSQQGYEFTVNGTGKGKTTIYFSKVNSILLNVKSESALDNTIELASMGMSMPMSIITSSEVKLIK